MIKALATVGIFGATTAAALGFAGTAQADISPTDTSNGDVSSYGTIGNDMIGASAGTGGARAWAGEYSLQVDGGMLMPGVISHTGATAPGVTYDAATLYDFDELEHATSFTAPGVTYGNHFEGYTNSFTSSSTLNGSTFTLECHLDTGCTTGDMMP